VSGSSALDGSSISTTGNQTYTGAVTLEQDTTLTGETINLVGLV